MSKIQLTIKSTYLPNWATYEGVRELIQNARDAEVEHSAPMKIDWYNDTLRIANEGTTLPTKALLLGHTSKVGNSAMIGKFGEGLKLGILALVRAGHAVKVRTGSEVWTPTLERSETFDEDVLTFRIEGGRSATNRVRVEVGGITKKAWEEMKGNFLFLNAPSDAEMIVTYNGTLLMGDQFKQRIYVKGIFVQNDPAATFGYDLKEVELDRDRKMVESWNLKYHTRQVLLSALNKREELFGQFMEMLENPTTETESLDSYSSYDIKPEIAQKAVDSFLLKHGPDAVPVENLGDSRDMEHLGKKGVVVSKPLGVVLGKVFGTLGEMKAKLQNEAIKTYSWSDLSKEEQSRLVGAIGTINEVEPLSLEDVDVVEFRSATMRGQYNHETKRISLSYGCLSDTDQTLRVLVHEVSHRAGDDGAKGHVHAIENLWMKLFSNLRTQINNRFDRV